MSQPSAFPTEIPLTTRQLVEPLLDEASVYRLIGEQVEQMVGDADFAEMYAGGGTAGGEWGGAGVNNGVSVFGEIARSGSGTDGGDAAGLEICIATRGDLERATLLGFMQLSEAIAQA